MTDPATVSTLVRPSGQPFAGIPRGRPAPFRPPEVPPRAAGKAEGGPPLAHPLLNAEGRLALQQDGETLSGEEKKRVRELQSRDRAVRAHEAAHKLAGGPYAGHPTFETVRGPDGRSYAVSGEVKIDTAVVPKNPDATIRKMEQVKRAALAPSNPSAKDRQVAAEADAKIQQARQEKREEEAEEREKAAGVDHAPAFRVAAGPDMDAADEPRHDVLI